MSWNELSLKDKADYIKESVNNGIYNLSDIRNRYNMYANGGYKPSESIKKRITNWEGSSMRTNRSFQAEANDFNRVIPSSIRSKLSQQQLDALYSYGYNVGMGNLKKRVLPTLTNYVQGKASNEDVQKSMWASKDNELRGLTTRRNIERSLFGGKYQTVFTGTGGTPHNYGYTATTNRNSSNPYQIQNEEWQGKNYLDAYKGLQLSMNNIMGKTKETDIDDLFSTGTGPIISMDNLLSIGNNTVAPVQPDYSYTKSLLSDFDSDLNSNIFAEGGNKDNNRTAMPAHPATNPYKRRSWETDEEYKERIQDLDNKSQEVALNDSTAINKYKEWEANIQKQQKTNEEKSKVITIEKNTKRAKTLEKEFNSLRNIPSQMSPNDTIQAINKNIPEAYKQQYINNINMYRPALDTIDLGINLYSLYNPTVPVLSAGLLTNGLQFGQSIVDDDLGATDYSALAFDTLGLLGATNKLPTRLRIGKNRFWDIDKTADYLGAGQNILDSTGDVYDLSKTGYHLYNNTGSNNLYMSPFEKSFDEGGNLNFIDADNRRSNILLHTEDGNLYDSTGNNYTQSYLDEEHIPIIKGTMPRNTRQYYDPNTTLEFINAAIAPISNFSPSNIVGSIREARDYNTFMNSFMNQDNTGFFTREYAKEHPYISTLGNIGGDILTGVALNKGYNTLKNNINSRINKRLFNEAMNNMANISDNRLDRIYNRLYNTGDYEDLQQLRDKHFEVKASNPLMNRDRPTQLYHTVGDEYDSSFNVFNPNIEGSNSAIYTTDNLAMSKSYSSKPTYNRVKKLYSNASKSYDIEGYYQPWNEIPYNGNIWSTRTLEKAVRNHPQYGIDRLVIHNIKDWGGKAMPKGTFLMDGNIKSSGTVIENFNPNDLKYSSAVTYDDLGNIIPLSKRDNFSIKDLRYSLIPLGTGVTLLNSKVK
nr:MAG: lysozyme [Bacteriophage sp.]